MTRGCELGARFWGYDNIFVEGVKEVLFSLDKVLSQINTARELIKIVKDYTQGVPGLDTHLNKLEDRIYLSENQLKHWKLLLEKNPQDISRIIKEINNASKKIASQILDIIDKINNQVFTNLLSSISGAEFSAGINGGSLATNNNWLKLLRYILILAVAMALVGCTTPSESRMTSTIEAMREKEWQHPAVEGTENFTSETIKKAIDASVLLRFSSERGNGSCSASIVELPDGSIVLATAMHCLVDTESTGRVSLPRATHITFEKDGQFYFVPSGYFVVFPQRLDPNDVEVRREDVAFVILPNEIQEILRGKAIPLKPFEEIITPDIKL